MNIQNTAQATAYFDITNLQQMAELAKSKKDADSKTSLEFAAKQFESLFIQMLFSQMRETEQAFKSDLLDNSDSEFYQEMYDTQLALNMSENNGIGLKEVILSQLKQTQSNEK